MALILKKTVPFYEGGDFSEGFISEYKLEHSTSGRNGSIVDFDVSLRKKTNEEVPYCLTLKDIEVCGNSEEEIFDKMVELLSRASEALKDRGDYLTFK